MCLQCCSKFVITKRWASEIVRRIVPGHRASNRKRPTTELAAAVYIPNQKWQMTYYEQSEESSQCPWNAFRGHDVASRLSDTTVPAHAVQNCELACPIQIGHFLVFRPQHPPLLQVAVCITCYQANCAKTVRTTVQQPVRGWAFRTHLHATYVISSKDTDVISKSPAFSRPTFYGPSIFGSAFRTHNIVS